MSERVPEENLSPTFEACPLCEFVGERAREVVLQPEPEVWMRRCPQCHASFADRFPDDAFLSRLYDPSHYSSPLTADDHLSARCADRILAHFKPAPDANLELVGPPRFDDEQQEFARALQRQAYTPSYGVCVTMSR